MVCYPIWMVDGRGEILPDRFFKAMGLTKSKPHRDVKRRGKSYVLSLDANEHRGLVVWGYRQGEPGWMVGFEAEGWLNHHFGLDWSYNSSIWFDSELEYDREFLEIRFPDLESLTLFRLTWATGD